MNEKTKTESWDKQAGAAQEDAEWAVDKSGMDSGCWINEGPKGIAYVATNLVARRIVDAHNSATASLRARNDELERRLKEFGGTQSRG